MTATLAFWVLVMLKDELEHLWACGSRRTAALANKLPTVLFIRLFSPIYRIHGYSWSQEGWSQSNRP